MTADPPECTYCLHPGADVCVRAVPTVSGARMEFAHAGCAAERDVAPLYRLVAVEAVQ
ncbi:hypothetical protein ACIQWN_29215 [Streptomyces vinaceus]|uniref:hypothetical protein n=1 Tax=Streptomyces vinaceus TaxID=1960 RepID=UPI0038017341